MAAIDPQPVNACDLECITPGAVWYAVLAALIDVGNGTVPPTDTNELLAQIACLECKITPGLLPYAILTAIRNLN